VPCFVHIHGGYWQRGSREIFACLAEGALAHGWSAALPGYTLAPEANLTQITNELRTAFDWLDAEAAEHGIEGPVIVTGWSAGGHLTAFILDHRKVAAGLSISGVFELAPLRDSPHVNDKVNLSEVEIETLFCNRAARVKGSKLATAPRMVVWQGPLFCPRSAQAAAASWGQVRARCINL
jgi:acetyl esterase/lipase